MRNGQQLTIIAVVFFLFISTFAIISYNKLEKTVGKLIPVEEVVNKNGNGSTNDSSDQTISNNIDNNINGGSNATIDNNVENNIEGNVNGNVGNDIQNDVNVDGEASLDNNVSNNISVQVDVNVSNNVNNNVVSRDGGNDNDGGDNGNGNGDNGDGNGNGNGNGEDGNKDDEERPEIVWGVDSASETTEEFYACVRENFGEPLVWGRYLGNVDGVSYGLTSEQVELIHSEGAEILLIHNQFNDATGYDNGAQQAELAIELAQELDAPEGVAIFANIEPFFDVDADFITGWYDVFADSEYIPGIYGIFDPERELYVQFNAAADENGDIRENTYLWTAAPNVGITTEAEAPDYEPIGPEDALIIGWQYGLDAETCNIDTNLFEGEKLDVLWGRD